MAPSRTTANWRQIGLQNLASGLGIILIAKFVYIFIPFANYAFDWDPSDGDFLNLVHRISAGLPLYSDWRSGHVLNLYMPLIHYLAWGGSNLGFDELRFVRALNLSALLVAISSVFFLTRRTFNDPKFGNGCGALGTIGFLVNWETFGNFASFRPDPLLLAVSTLTFCAVTFNWGVWVTAGLCILAVLAKQTGIAVVASVAVCFWMFNRSNFLPLCAAFISLFGVVVVFCAISGSALIWRSCFLDPNVYLVRTPEWESLWTLFRGLCNGKSFWIYLIAGFGAYASIAEKSRIGIICIIFLGSDAIYLVRTAASPGAGVSYFWFNWFVCIILAIQGSRFLAERFGSATMITALALALMVMDGKALLRLIVQPPKNLEDCTRISLEHVSLIRSFSEQNGNWVTERNGVALVKSGKMLDQEMCTFGTAASGTRGAEMATAFSKELADGKYRFYQRESQRTFPMPSGVDLVLNSKFRKVADSKLIDRGDSKSVEILEFIPEPVQPH
ncbi:MAG: hypothetical protein QOI04_1126 [Verrucomicrobiota bacterium]|jgi:hypothetical protein